MKSKKVSLDNTVNEFRLIRGAPKKGDIGIELEMEWHKDPYDHISKWSGEQGWWVTKGEGSLRDFGTEFVLDQPVAMGDVSKALQSLKEILLVCQPKTSIRCSTHYHVNVYQTRYRNVYNAIGLYYLLESLLVTAQGPERVGNLFCLRMVDAEALAPALVESVKTGQYGLYFSPQQYRYSALNLSALNKFGSLEFRFVRGLSDTNEIAKWADILYTVVEKGAKKNPIDWCLELDRSGPEAFLRRIFSKEICDNLASRWSLVELEDLLSENYDAVFRLGTAMRKKRKYETDPSLWEEDQVSRYDEEELPMAWVDVQPATPFPVLEFTTDDLFEEE